MMVGTSTDFAKSIERLADKIQKNKKGLRTEKATIVGAVQPFIQALGYDISDPFEAVPEFVADIAGRNGEKVDYAIMRDNKPAIIIECKVCGTNLNDVTRNQLHRYFLTLDSCIAILTDGVRYLFFTTADDGKNMDTTPFMEFNFDNIDYRLLPELEKFCKSNFDLKTILSTADELKFTNQIKSLLFQNLEAPDDGFVSYFMDKIGARATAIPRERFYGYVKRAFTDFLQEYNQMRACEEIQENVTGATEEEMEGYNIVKTVLQGISHRLQLSTGVEYCTVRLDNNRFKSICRMFLRFKQVKYFETIDKEGVSTKHRLTALDDIYKWADEIKSRVNAIEG